jgi:hypothetical protein
MMEQRAAARGERQWLSRPQKGGGIQNKARLDRFLDGFEVFNYRLQT